MLDMHSFQTIMIVSRLDTRQGDRIAHHLRESATTTCHCETSCVLMYITTIIQQRNNKRSCFVQACVDMLGDLSICSGSLKLQSTNWTRTFTFSHVCVLWFWLCTLWSGWSRGWCGRWGTSGRIGDCRFWWGGCRGSVGLSTS